VRFAHDMRLCGERRPTHIVGLPGFLLAPSLAAKAGSLSGILPYATLAHPWVTPFRASCPTLQTHYVCVPSPRSPRAHRIKINSQRRADVAYRPERDGCRLYKVAQ